MADTNQPCGLTNEEILQQALCSPQSALIGGNQITERPLDQLVRALQESSGQNILLTPQWLQKRKIRTGGSVGF